jgi:NAD(P)-dependent dehydrogenase (short-subunit alcohol dehydrogenase family)
MPSDDGLGLDEDQCRPPLAPGGRQQDPKHAVTGAEVRPLHASLQGSQLVAEGQILEDHVVVATAGHGDRPQEQQGQFKHVLILSGGPVESNTGSAMARFWRTTAFGGVDILVNNAGGYPITSWWNTPAEVWIETYNTDVVAGVRLVKALVPGMIERGWGRVIQIASRAATADRELLSAVCEREGRAASHRKQPCGRIGPNRCHVECD